MHSSHIMSKGRGLYHLLEGKYLHVIGKSSAFIYSFNIFKKDYICIDHGYYFVLWVTIQSYTLDFVVQITLTLCIEGGSFIWLLCSFSIPPSFCFLSTSLLNGTAGCSRLILYVPCSNPRAISPRSLVSVIGELF